MPRLDLESPEEARWSSRAATDQFRASLQRHLDALIEEEDTFLAETSDCGGKHQYAASLLREIKAWAEVS